MKLEIYIHVIQLVAGMQKKEYLCLAESDHCLGIEVALLSMQLLGQIDPLLNGRDEIVDWIAERVMNEVIFFDFVEEFVLEENVEKRRAAVHSLLG